MWYHVCAQGWDYRDIVHVYDSHQGMSLLLGLLGSEVIPTMHDRNYSPCCYMIVHFNVFPSMVVRQPKGPDGTKGFTHWQTTRSANSSPTAEKTNTSKETELKASTAQ